MQDSSALSALSAASAGATGALMTTVLFYPVELVKNRLQAAVRGGSGYAYTSLVDGLQTIVQEEGLAGLFVGFRPIVARALASDFATIGLGELLVLRFGGGATELPLRIVGGWGSVMCTLPLETISARVTCSRPPVTVSTAIRQLFHEGGARSFWRGLHVMLVLCVNPALTLTAFNWLRTLYDRLCRRSLKGKEHRFTWVHAFFIGALAKMLTLCAVYPLIRAKFLLQAGDGTGDGLLHVCRNVVYHEGFCSLYKGLDAQLGKSLLSTALMLAVKERTEDVWRSYLLRRHIKVSA